VDGQRRAQGPARKKVCPAHGWREGGDVEERDRTDLNASFVVPNDTPNTIILLSPSVAGCSFLRVRRSRRRMASAREDRGTGLEEYRLQK
jgi:hypothetical protein